MKKPTVDMVDLLRRAKKYVNAKEEMAARKQKTTWSGHQAEKGEHSRSAPGKKEKRKEMSELPKDDLRHKLSNIEESPRGGTPILTYNNFAHLLETRTRILAVEKDKIPIQWIAPLRSVLEKKDSDKYYRYHRDHGHDVEECRHLKNQIENLIQKGHLCKYVGRNAPQERRERREEAPQQPEEQQPRRVIHIISGGVSSGVDSNRSRKAYARQTFVVQQYQQSKRLKIGGDEEVISFSEVNYEGVRLPHDDPVVVTLEVTLFTMKRILLDSGCSTDILYKHAFDQLRIPTDQLRPVKTPPVGFAREMVYPLGSIDLSIVTRTTPRQTQVQMTFLVVTHQAHTRFGVGEVRGDQQVQGSTTKLPQWIRGRKKYFP
ncbi:hypothetical protein CFOL_v3_00408 [Cephalotus follicularis]|uniref:Uncharacterized protein n=1 Tax=Cephalotus follicularis TaxID=3775 RepID=A0A1Q3AM86_CEPFO|nr:hypothetical protein CFOL_v3_00408 [Cephalotus follicularis]